MKSAFFLLLLSAFIIAITALPANDDPTDTQYPWYNSNSYQQMMCRMNCRQSCLEQGYWRGACKLGTCYCFGPMGPYARASGFPMPMN